MVNTTDFSYPYMSYTAIQTYISCPRRFRYRYVDLIREEPDSTALIRGKLVHEAYEKVFDVLEPRDICAIGAKDTIGNFGYHKTALFAHFMNALESVANKSHPIYNVDNERFIAWRCFHSYSVMMVRYFHHIVQETGLNTPAAISEFFFPETREQTFFNEKLQIFGKLDQTFALPDGGIQGIDFKVRGNMSPKLKTNQQESLQARIYLNLMLSSTRPGGRAVANPKNTTMVFVYPHVVDPNMPYMLSVNYSKSFDTRMLNRIDSVRQHIDNGDFEPCYITAPMSKRQIPQNEHPFIFKRVCCFCEHVERCHGMEADLFNSHVSRLFKVK